jgi:PAS domain S-box-containing protein
MTQPRPAPESGELLRLVFDHAVEGLCVFDAALKLQAWNQHFLDFTGLPPALVHEGAALADLLHAMVQAGEFSGADADTLVRRRLQELASGPAAVVERTRPNGQCIELRRSPTPGGGFVMFYADITGRKAAQAHMADQQRMLSLLIERTEQGIWFIDNELRTTDANPAMCRMLGVTLPQLLGRTIYEFADADNERTFRANVARRDAGGASSYEITLTRADGSPVHCYNNATPIYNAQGQKVGAVGMFSDISPLKRAEQQIRMTGDLLAQKSHVLEVTLDSLLQGVLSVEATGRTNAYNRRFVELMQIPDAFMRQRPTVQEVRAWQMANGHIPYDDIVGDQPWLARPALYRRTSHDGTVLEIRTHRADDGSIVRTYTDVTDSVASQARLQESESRFRTMADAAPAFIWLSDVAGKPLWFNQRWLTHTGRDLAQELALGWTARLHPADLKPTRRVFDDAARRCQSYATEFRLLRSDGQVVWLADQGIPRLAPDGRFEGFIVYGWDITERRAAEAALMAAKDEAERANRAKSDFLSRMSHELRTPLNAVLGFGQLLETDRSEPLGPVQRSRVQELLRGGRHLLSLINDVLDLARIEAGTLLLDLVPVDLDRLVRECLPLMEPAAAARGVVMAVHPAGAEAGAVLADRTRLKQVLLNLLSNAVKYNRPGGRVDIRWHVVGEAVRIEVVDTGPGLDAQQQERLFHAFERLDAARTEVEGAGIGLALSKWLVDLMQGAIGVTSAPGQGSNFWVALVKAEGAPAAAATAGATAAADVDAPAAAWSVSVPLATGQPPALATPVAAHRHTVIYIEDNEVNQLLMQGMLAQRPALRLLMAAHPDEGLALAWRERPDLVLLDIQLPGMDGFEVLRRLRADPRTRRVPVLAVSANAMPADRERAAEAGFADYVTKPIDLPRLLSLLDRLLPG